MSLRAGPATRYGRVALADLGLVAAGIGTGEPAAVGGGLVLILTHLVVAPLLLQSAAARARVHPAGWSGWPSAGCPPPRPSGGGSWCSRRASPSARRSGPPAWSPGGLVTVAAVLAVARGRTGSGAPAPHHRVAAAWRARRLALAVGLLPMGAVHLVFGPGA